MASEITVLIADDHPIFRRGLRQVIDGEPDMRVVAEADQGEAALEGLRAHRPDVAVLDIRMPRASGLDVAQRVREEGLPTRILFLTMHDQAAMFERAMALGAAGYVLKDAALSEIVHAIRTAGTGRTFVSPALSDYLVARAFPTRQSGVPVNPEEAATGIASLTPRERHLLRLIADAQTSKEIATVFGVHYRTIENQRSAISQKLGLQGSHALVKFAFDHRDEL